MPNSTSAQVQSINHSQKSIELRLNPGERHGTVSRALKERGLASTPSIDGPFLEDRGLWPVGGWVRSQHAHVDLRTDGRKHARVRTRGLLTNLAPIQIKCTCIRKRRTGISLATLIYTLQCSDLPYRRVLTAPRVPCPPNRSEQCSRLSGTKGHQSLLWAFRYVRDMRREKYPKGGRRRKRKVRA
jgi:hypothetical protein